MGGVTVTVGDPNLGESRATLASICSKSRNASPPPSPPPMLPELNGPSIGKGQGDAAPLGAAVSECFGSSNFATLGFFGVVLLLVVLLDNPNEASHSLNSAI